MRTISMLATAGLLVVPLLSVATAEEKKDARVYYDHGMNIETDAARLRLNTLVQALYTYEDVDNSEARGEEDSSSFDMRRVRIKASGDVLNKEFSYLLQNDFIEHEDDTGKKESELLDAWLQWNNGEDLMLRMGQFKVPYSLQWMADAAALQMINRSTVTGEFSLDRQAGAMLHGGCEASHYYLSVTNGESVGEGLNRSGQDADLLGTGMLTYSANGYDRSFEGDITTTDGVAWTTGLGASYGSAKDEGIGIDTTRVGGDFGVRSGGLSAQAEIHYRSEDMDGADTTDDLGYYIQAGYFVVPEVWEVAGRFSAIDPDSHSSEEDAEEYALVLSRFLNGHSLKLQVGATWINEDIEGGDSTTDARYQFQVSGYF